MAYDTTPLMERQNPVSPCPFADKQRICRTDPATTVTGITWGVSVVGQVGCPLQYIMAGTMLMTIEITSMAFGAGMRYDANGCVGS